MATDYSLSTNFYNFFYVSFLEFEHVTSPTNIVNVKLKLIELYIYVKFAW